MFLVFIYFLFVNITLVVPGYVLTKKLKLFDKNPGLQIILAYTFTIVLYAFLSTVTYALKIDSSWSRDITWIAILLSILILIKDGLFRGLVAKYIFPLACMIAMSIFSLLFIALSFNAPRNFAPDPRPEAGRNYSALNVKILNIAQTQANDNYVPYRQAQFYINRSDPAKDSFIGEWGVDFFVRTPLMGAVTANYLSLLGDKPPIDYSWSSTSNDADHTYIKFQVLAQILNSLFIIPAFYLLIKLFNKKTASISLLFMVPSIYFVYNDFFSWPKSLVAFFILTSWLLLLEKKPKYTLLAGIVSGVAYLTHDLAILYIGASFIYLLIGKRFKEILFFIIPPALLALPWLITASIIYDKPSNFIYYPLSTRGIPQPADKINIFQNFLHTSPLKLIKIRIDNIIYLLSPYQLLTSEGGKEISDRLWALSLYSVPGALGLGLIIPAFIGLFKKMLSWTGAIFVFVPVLLCTAVIGWPKGLGALHFAQALVVILVGLSINYLDSLKNKIWLMLAFFVNIAQLIFFTLYSYRFAVGEWFGSLEDLAVIAVILIIIGICSWLIYRIERDKSDKFIKQV